MSIALNVQMIGKKQKINVLINVKENGNWNLHIKNISKYWQIYNSSAYLRIKVVIHLLQVIIMKIMKNNALLKIMIDGVFKEMMVNGRYMTKKLAMNYNKIT